MTGGDDGSPYAVTLERGTDGTYLAWVDELPGCAIRGRSRGEVFERLPEAIRDFLAWSGNVDAAWAGFVVAEETEAEIAAEEDTEVLLSTDRRPLTPEDMSQMQEWLARSRAELRAVLDLLSDEELATNREGSERSVREEFEHIAFVELMYAAWTFDLASRSGLEEFLAWTRAVVAERMSALAADPGAAELTWARWAGAPRPEAWTPRKAVRRLVWHELLHLHAIEKFAERRSRRPEQV